jgi:hypothetical protein
VAGGERILRAPGAKRKSQSPFGHARQASPHHTYSEPSVEESLFLGPRRLAGSFYGSPQPSYRDSVCRSDEAGERNELTSKAGIFGVRQLAAALSFE